MQTAKKLSKVIKAHDYGNASVKTLMRNKSEAKKKNANAKIFLAKLTKRMVDT